MITMFDDSTPPIDFRGASPWVTEVATRPARRRVRPADPGLLHLLETTTTR
jgi:hypothetical protein